MKWKSIFEFRRHSRFDDGTFNTSKGESNTNECCNIWFWLSPKWNVEMKCLFFVGYRMGAQTLGICEFECSQLASLKWKPTIWTFLFFVLFSDAKVYFSSFCYVTLFNGHVGHDGHVHNVCVCLSLLLCVWVCAHVVTTSSTTIQRMNFVRIFVVVRKILLTKWNTKLA